MSTLKATNIQNPASSLINITTDTSGGVAFPQLTGLVKANGSSSATAAVAGTDYVAVGGAGTRVLLNTLTALNSASLTDTTSLTATYTYYEIVFDSLLAAGTTALLLLQPYVSGYQNTGIFSAFVYAAPTNGVLFSSNTTGILIGASNTTGSPTFSGRTFVSNPSSSTTKKLFHGVATASYSTGTQISSGSGGGYFNTNTNAVTGFQILFTAGNITSGTVAVYGWN